MRVLLVEDDFAISQSIETMLKKEGMIEKRRNDC